MSGLSPQTIAFYEEKLAKLPQDDSLLELTKGDLQELLYSMSCGQGGKQAHLRAFKALFNWIEDSDVVTTVTTFWKTGYKLLITLLQIRSPFTLAVLH